MPTVACNNYLYFEDIFGFQMQSQYVSYVLSYLMWTITSERLQETRNLGRKPVLLCQLAKVYEVYRVEHGVKSNVKS